MSNVTIALARANQTIRAVAALLEAEAGELKVVGMPKKFWLCVQPQAGQELGDCCQELSFDAFMDKVAGGLTKESILGVFKRKGDAEQVAKKAMRAVDKDAKKAAEEAEEAQDAADLAEQETDEANEAAEELPDEPSDDAGDEEALDEEEPAEEEEEEPVDEGEMSASAKAIRALTMASRALRKA